MQQSPEDPRLHEARRYVAALRGFYIHAVVFALVMGVLLAINAVSKSDWWVHWALIGWGIGLIGHAIGVFAPVSLFGRSWEERKIRERMQRRP
jgi:hypothetical protein